MKILHVNTSANAGGAAIAAQRIIQAERKLGVEASLLTRNDTPDGPHAGDGQWNFLMERLGVWLNEGLRTRHLWAIDPATHGTDITSLPEFQAADAIHLHWVNQGMLSLRGLEKIRRSGKPIVWTMHDMWPFTGVCHHAEDCSAWQDGTACSSCRLNSRLAHRTYLRKQAMFKDGMGESIRFVACSQWLADKAQHAPLLSQHTVTVIPNPIDTEFYAPAPDAAAARWALGLPQDRPLVLFVAYKATDPNKGLHYLQEAMHDVDADIVVVGKGKVPPHPRQHVLGLVDDAATMRTLYQACNVLAMPTLMDNLPNTIMEGMACGLPCVGFRVGGVPEMIDHNVNGYLADYRSSADMARGLQWVLAQTDDALRRAARQKALENYSEAAVAARYISLYENSKS